MQINNDDCSESITDIAAAVILNEAFQLKKDPFCRSVLRAFRPHSVHYLHLMLGRALHKKASAKEIEKINRLIDEFEPKRRAEKEAKRPSKPRGAPPVACAEYIEFLRASLPKAAASPRYEAWLSARDNLRRGKRSRLLYLLECIYTQVENMSQEKARRKAEKIIKTIENKITNRAP